MNAARGALILLAAAMSAAAAQEPDARQLAPWLDLPKAWSHRVATGRVVMVPNELAPGASLRFTAEPPALSDEDLAAAYRRTTRELGEWTPVGALAVQEFETGWVFHHGLGVARIAGETYTAIVAVARKEGFLARFWGLADGDDTFNRYQGTLMVGISSVQDVRLPSMSEPSVAPPAPAGVDPGFGTGVAGAYLGLERGARAGAGAASMELVLDLSTNYLSIGASPGAPQVMTSVQDYPEVDVFLPDGSYRRGLPVRGLAADLNWDRAALPVAWGTWRLEGDRIVTRRGSYVTTYVVRGDVLQSERDRPWRKLPAMANLRLDGVYARADYRDLLAPRLLLRADGSYEDCGDFLRMIGAAWNLGVPDGDTGVERWSDADARRAMGSGGGTYTLEAYTLTLRDRDGRVWQFNAYVPPKETLPAARYLVMNGYTLIRD